MAMPTLRSSATQCRVCGGALHVCTPGHIQAQGDAETRVLRGRRGLLNMLLDGEFRVLVYTHYYGPVMYQHLPLLCLDCGCVHFHTWITPGHRTSASMHMLLTDNTSTCVCLQISFGRIAFSLDFLQYFEAMLQHGRVTFTGFLRAYRQFWHCIDDEKVMDKIVASVCVLCVLVCTWVYFCVLVCAYVFF